MALASPRTPGTVWVVPVTADLARLPAGGRLRAHRTRDAGETSVALGESLPGANWNTVLRDAACVDCRPPDCSPP